MEIPHCFGYSPPKNCSGGIFTVELFRWGGHLIQILLTESIVYWWSISVLIHPIYWLLFGPASRFEGIGVRFFDTPLRSIILAETIGIGGSTINVLLGINTPFTMIFLTVLMTPIVIVSAYLSQGLKKKEVEK